MVGFVINGLVQLAILAVLLSPLILIIWLIVRLTGGSKPKRGW